MEGHQLGPSGKEIDTDLAGFNTVIEWSSCDLAESLACLNEGSFGLHKILALCMSKIIKRCREGDRR